MEKSIPLIKYLENTYDDIGPLIVENDLIFRDFDDYIKLLTQSKVVLESSCTRSNPDEILQLDSYFEVLDTIIAILTRENSKNVLVNGYYDPSSAFIWSTGTFNPFVSSGVNTIKGSNWQRLYNRIGKERFVSLLLNTKCFIPGKNGSYVQLFGSKTNVESRPKLTTLKHGMLFRRPYTMTNQTQLLCLDPTDLVYTIMKHKAEKESKRMPKKYRGLRRLCEKFIHNDTKCKYFSMYSNICIRGKTNTGATSLREVISLVLAIVKKIFPDDTFGSSYNKRKTLRYIVAHINSGLNDKFLIDEIICSLKLTDISWLGKTSRTTSLQDFESRKRILSAFLNWLISSFISNIIAKFWYVTDISHGGDKKLFFYPHRTWNNMSDNWIENFQSACLKKCNNFNLNGANDVFNTGVLRVLPKSNGFRALCVPLKVDRERNLLKYDYTQYLNDYIKPIKKIILHKQRCYLNQFSSLSICNSIEDVARLITHYKSNLKSKFGKIPTLYFSKFDMENCFDNINHDRLFSCIKKIFNDDDPDKCYYVRQYMEYRGTFSKKNFDLQTDNLDNYTVINNEGEMNHNSSLIVIDKTQTSKFTKSTILRFLKNVIYKSYVILPNGEKFIRKKGISQGFPLLGPLCDLFYSIFIHEQLDHILQPRFLDTLLVRLVDDFLIVSSDPHMCQTVFDIVNGPKFKNQGAIVNKEKTFRTTSIESLSLEFIGLRIVTSSLDIYRDLEFIGNSQLPPHVRSFEKGYSSLQCFYNNKLRDFLISLKTNSFGTILENINLSVNLTLDLFYNLYKKLRKNSHQFKGRQFQIFVLKLLEATLLKYKRINETSQGIKDITVNFKISVTAKLRSLRIKGIESTLENLI